MTSGTVLVLILGLGTATTILGVGGIALGFYLSIVMFNKKRFQVLSETSAREALQQVTAIYTLVDKYLAEAISRKQVDTF